MDRAVGREISAPNVKQQLAAIRHLFDWLVNSQVVPVNSAASVRGPDHVMRSGKTPVLELAEARLLLDLIDATTLAMKVEDVFTQSRRLWVASLSVCPSLVPGSANDSAPRGAIRDDEVVVFSGFHCGCVF